MLPVVVVVRTKEVQQMVGLLLAVTEDGLQHKLLVQLLIRALVEEPVDIQAVVG
jgi:hypothetical protein